MPDAKRKGGATPGKAQTNPKGKPALAAAAPTALQPARPTKPDFAPSAEPLYATYDQPKPEGCWFDEEAAQRAVDFIEGLSHYQGEFAGQPFWLLPWQERLVREMFGWKNPDGSRLYRTVYLEVPRKAGKTTLAAAVGLYLAYGDNEAGPQVCFAAKDRDQANYSYGTARVFAEQHPVLGPQSVFYNSRKEVVLAQNPGGVIKCLSSETSKLYGLNLHALVFDELMTQPNRIMWDALRTSMGARRQPMTFAISTAGWDKHSVCFELHEHARGIAAGEESDPTFLGVVYGAPEGADWTDPATWRASNPSLGVTVAESYYAQECQTALAMPTAQNSFRTLLLSQWVGQETRYIPMEAWDSNSRTVDLDGLLPKLLEDGDTQKRSCFGGLDLSSTTDLSAFVLVFPNDDDTVDVVARFFVPEERLRERGLKDRVPYEQWVKDGYITTTPGRTIRQSDIRDAIRRAAELYGLKDVSFDRWNATGLVQELEAGDENHDRVTMVEMGQGMASMSNPTKQLLQLVLDKRLNHGGNPVLRWMAENTAAKVDEAGNVKPDKAKSTARIDGIVGLVMAIDGWTRRGPSLLRRSVYEDRGLFTFEQSEES
jgi:phage terminase large subunit-like protein